MRFNATTTKWIRLVEEEAWGRKGGGTMWVRVVSKEKEVRLLGGTTMLKGLTLTLLALKSDGKLVGNKVRCVKDVDFSLKMWKRKGVRWDEVWMSQGDGVYREKGGTILTREARWNERLQRREESEWERDDRSMREIRQDHAEKEMLLKKIKMLEEDLLAVRQSTSMPNEEELKKATETLLSPVNRAATGGYSEGSKAYEEAKARAKEEAEAVEAVKRKATLNTQELKRAENMRAARKAAEEAERKTKA